MRPAAILIAIGFLAGCSAAADQGVPEEETVAEVKKSDAEWRQELTDIEYRVLRQEDTQRAFSGDLWDNKAEGTYVCAGCGQEVFTSEAKFRSGTGWPSFYEPADTDAIGTREDRSLFVKRTEVHCSGCGGHLGHVFPDGPEPTGLRYCINDAALDFVPGEP